MDASPSLESAQQQNGYETTVPGALLDALARVEQEARNWYRELSVSMGQAQKLTDLKDSQIRYFEELGALQPQKTSRQAGASRLYTIPDLRRLRVLSLLTRQGLRAAEAADILKHHSQLVDQGANPSVVAVLTHEQRAVADGFLLARVVSQILGAIQAELMPSGGEPSHKSPMRVCGAVFPRRVVFASEQPDHTEIQRTITDLLQNPAGMLLARVRASDTTDFDYLPEALVESDQNTQIALFFSEDTRDLGWEPCPYYCMYAPLGKPQQIVIALVDADAGFAPPVLLQSLQAARMNLLDILLELAEHIWKSFCHYTLAKNYRYRSDGFPLSQTRQTYTYLLQMIRGAMFPGDEQAMAVLLVPDNLDQPTSLSILAHDGYSDELAKRARLDLRGKEPQGLSGRAYRLREPFLTLDAARDPYIEYAFAEGSRQALAVPLATSWGIAPFGVLYVATRQEPGALTSTSVYAAMVLGTALSEMLGRWWLTRLRRELDMTLHRQIEHLVRWIDSLDVKSPDFDRGLQAILRLRDDISATQHDPVFLRKKLVLAVLDIDQYRETVQARSNELLPIAAQRHVREAIATIDSTLNSYWFNNDHALLILHCDTLNQAMLLIERIQDQVSATPIRAFRRDGAAAYISISAAWKMINFRALHDMGNRGDDYLRQQISTIVEHLCQETQRAEPGSVTALDRAIPQQHPAGVPG